MAEVAPQSVPVPVAATPARPESAAAPGEPSPLFARPDRWVAGFVAVGLALRVYHYLRDPSVWIDEAALIVNVLQKGFAELLGPLIFTEAAPPLFLWIERAVVLTLGDSTYALRLVPFLAGCAALLWMVPLARRVFEPPTVPWAIGFVALSQMMLFHTTEAKSYAVDVLAGVAVAWMYVSLRERPTSVRCAVPAAFAPLWIFVSYPGCFLYGGLMTALLPAAWRDRRTAAAAAAYLGLVLIVFGCFAALLLGPIRNQRGPSMDACWVEMGGFPPTEAAQVPLWIVRQSVSASDYLLRPAGGALLPMYAIGAVLLSRRGRGDLAILLALPALLPPICSFWHAYPFSGSRIIVFTLPAAAILSAEGLRAWAAWTSRRFGRATALLPAVPLAAAAGLAAFQVVVPKPRADAAGAAAYVLAHRRAGDVIVTGRWELQYYFRNLSPEEYRASREPPAHVAGDIWYISFHTREDLRAAEMRDITGAGWTVAETIARERAFIHRMVRGRSDGERPAPPG